MDDDFNNNNNNSYNKVSQRTHPYRKDETKLIEEEVPWNPGNCQFNVVQLSQPEIVVRRDYLLDVIVILNWTD